MGFLNAFHENPTLYLAKKYIEKLIPFSTSAITATVTVKADAWPMPAVELN